MFMRVINELNEAGEVSVMRAMKLADETNEVYESRL